MRVRVVLVLTITLLTVAVYLAVMKIPRPVTSMPSAPEKQVETIKLSEKFIAPGESQVSLKLDLPGSLEFVPDNPPEVGVYSEDLSVFYPGPVDNSDPLEPYIFKYRAYDGTTELKVDYKVFCCEEEDKAICFSREGRLIIPIKVGEGGLDTLKINYLVDR